MGADTATEHYLDAPRRVDRRGALSSAWSAAVHRARIVLTAQLLLQLGGVFVAYFLAGKLGQATTNIRSSNLGPVWPASGIAVAAFLAYGYRIWPAVAASAFAVAYLSPVPWLAAAGQAAGAAAAAASATFFVRRIAGFDPVLGRLRDALGLITLAAFGSAVVSASIGMASLYFTNVQPYSGLGSAWLIYWLGDSTGVLLVTPLVFTLPALAERQSRSRRVELCALLALCTAACLVVFADLAFEPDRVHALTFAVLPFVMWAAIGFGIGGAALTVFLIATIATLSTALGLGPFAANTPFVAAVLLDVLFMVLAVSGLTLAAVIAERERAEAGRAQLIRERGAMETRLRLAAIVESSNDAILSTDKDGQILSWNAAAERIFGFTAAEAVGRNATMLIPASARHEETRFIHAVKSGARIDHFETVRLTKAGETVAVSLTMSPLLDADGRTAAATIYRDISEEKRAHEALSSVNRKLIAAQEQERSRIARELHDDVAQRLAVLTFEVDDLIKNTNDAAPLQQKAETLREHVSELASDVSALSHELHSPRLELLGITAAGKDFCEKAARQHDVTVVFDALGVPARVPPDIALCMYRVLQEAVHNAAKHSGVRHIQVQLRGTPDHIHLAVSDRGCGFDVDAARFGRGLGLVSMAERIKLVDGELSIDSTPRRGTTISVRVRLRGGE